MKKLIILLTVGLVSFFAFNFNVKATVYNEPIDISSYVKSYNLFGLSDDYINIINSVTASGKKMLPIDYTNLRTAFDDLRRLYNKSTDNFFCKIDYTADTYTGITLYCYTGTNFTVSNLNLGKYYFKKGNQSYNDAYYVNYQLTNSTNSLYANYFVNYYNFQTHTLVNSSWTLNLNQNVAPIYINGTYGIGTPLLKQDMVYWSPSINFDIKYTQPGAYDSVMDYWNYIIFNGTQYGYNSKLTTLIDGIKIPLETSMTYTTVLNDNNTFNVNMIFTNLNNGKYASWKNYGTTEYGPIPTDTINFSLYEQLANTVIEITIYNADNSILKTYTVDLALINKNKPYVEIKGFNLNNHINSVTYKYQKASDTKNICKYQIGNGTITTESCDGDMFKSREASTNTFINFFIYDKNNNLLYDRSENLNFLTNMPYFIFTSEYDKNLYGTVLNIDLRNYLDTDIVSYSLDNSNWTDFTNVSFNQLTYFENKTVYFKVTRNSEIITLAKYDVIVDIPEYQQNNTSTLIKIIQNAINSISTVTSLFSQMFNMILKTQFGALILISLAGAVLILIIAIFKK